MTCCLPRITLRELRECPFHSESVFFLHWGWDAVDLGNCPKSESSRKWLGEGAKGLLDPASKRPLALVRNGAAPVQKRVWVVQKTLGRPLLPGAQKSQKDLLHPPLTTFGDFPFLGNFPGPQHPNIGVVPRCLIHLATKGVRQKEFDKKVTTKGASLQKMHLKNFKHITLKRKSPKCGQTKQTKNQWSKSFGRPPSISAPRYFETTFMSDDKSWNSPGQKTLHNKILEFPNRGCFYL